MKQQMNKKFWRTFGTVFLEALVIVTVILIFLWMTQLAYYSFSNIAYDDKKTTATVQITNDTTLDELSEQLKEENIIGSSYALVMRYYCSEYQNYELCPGTYHVSSGMGIDDLLEQFTGREYDSR